MNHHDINITLTPGHNEDPTRSRTFTVSFFNTEIHTTVTSTPVVARQWVHSLRRTHLRWYLLSRYSPVIGLGVQWKPSSTSAATLQLSIDKKCLIFQLSHSPAIPATLRDLLLDDRVTFFGVHNGRDRSLLQGSHHELDVNNLVDLAEEENGHYLNWSMEDMAEDVLGFSGVHKPRKVMLSDWDQYCLSNDQLQYACVDAYQFVWIAKRKGKEGEGNRKKGREGKGREEVRLIFPPNLSNYGGIMVIKEGGKMDPSISLPFLLPSFYPNEGSCPPPFSFPSFPSTLLYPNKVYVSVRLARAYGYHRLDDDDDDYDDHDDDDNDHTDDDYDDVYDRNIGSDDDGYDADDQFGLDFVIGRVRSSCESNYKETYKK